MKKGKATVSIYVYIAPRKKRDLTTIDLGKVLIDIDNKTHDVVGYEFLDCYGVEVNGETAKP